MSVKIQTETRRRLGTIVIWLLDYMQIANAHVSPISLVSGIPQ